MYDNDVNTKVNTMITKGKIHPQQQFLEWAGSITNKCDLYQKMVRPSLTFTLRLEY